MTLESSLPLLLWGLAVGTTVWGTWFSLKQFTKLRVANPLYPPVSILKPAKGAESGFVENNEIFFNLDYPCYELIYSVADSGDPVIPILEGLRKQYPICDARLIIGDEPIGPNPKVNNLVRSYAQAKYDLLLISDSNVRVDADYLKRIVPLHKTGVGVVTAVVAGAYPQGLGGRLEATYLNSFYARWMQISQAVGHSFVVGKQMLFRRTDMDRFGGIQNLGRYIAEDYMAGQAMRRLGLKVVIAGEPIRQYIGKHTLADFWSRHLRWGRIRKAQAPLAFVFEPLFFSTVSGVIGALGFNAWLGIPFALALALHLGLWLCLDLLLMARLEPKITWRSAAGVIGSWFIRESLAMPLWIHMALGSSVYWRGTRLKISNGGLVEILSEHIEHGSPLPMGYGNQLAPGRR